MQIGDGALDVTICQEEYKVSCLDINPLGEDQDFSVLAAVGLWPAPGVDSRVYIFSLPSLEPLKKMDMGDTVCRSVLLCELEGICYLLCARGDGLLLKYLLDPETGHLEDRTEVSDSQPITLRMFKPTILHLFLPHLTHLVSFTALTLNCLTAV